jgi:hypothetical protein
MVTAAVKEEIAVSEGQAYGPGLSSGTTGETR